MKREEFIDTIDSSDYIYVKVGTKSNGGKPRFQAWDECWICGHDFPKSKFVYWHGRPYCRPMDAIRI